MRIIITSLIAVLSMAVPALAQMRWPHTVPSMPPPRDPPPHFTIAPRGAALPSIGLPLPQVGLGPVRGDRHAPPHRQFSSFYGWPPVVFYVPQPVTVLVPVGHAPVRPIPPPPMPGRLFLEVEPADAQIFADGYYVGIGSDFSAAGGGGTLDAGVHRIDVSAPGYEGATVNLRMAAGQSVTYRAALKAFAAPAAGPPTTFYMIPGCYMGNIHPKDANLPASCDPGRAISWHP